MRAIAAEGLVLMRGSRTVLDQVSLAGMRGELIGVVGPNGAGKTSLMRVLAGLEPPAEGAVALDDAPLATLSPQTRARRIAYLAQSDALAWPLETQALVALGRIPHRAVLSGESAHDREAATRALARCDAQIFKGRAVTTLSAGERARVLLARALAVEAPVLLADEPIAALDPLHQLTVMTLLRDEARRGACVIVVLHELSLAMRFCDRLAVLHAGRLAAIGRPAEIVGNGVLEHVFATRFFQGTHEGAQFVLPWVPL